MSKKKFRKSVESIRYQILIHHQKIANEEQKESPDENLITGKEKLKVEKKVYLEQKSD